MRFFHKSFLIRLFIMLAVFGSGPSLFGQERTYTHMVVLSDPHLPGRNMPLKQKTVETINAWPDLDRVVVLGDICNDLGTTQELSYAGKFFAQVNKPLFPITGNHDYIYGDQKPAQGRREKASPSLRQEKLKRFQEGFSLPDLKYSKKVDPYLLIFLSVDELHSTFLTEISEKTLEWLQAELKDNKDKPTIIFFHAPLRGTLMSQNKDTEKDNFIAQPHRKIRKMIQEYPQIFMWVSGHTHIAPPNIRFHHPVNVFEKRVTNIHNCDMDGRSYLSDTDYEGKGHGNIWTNSLYFYPQKVVVKTYDHRNSRWMDHLTRDIFPNK